MHPQWTQLEFTANFGDTEVRKTGGCGHKYVPGMMLGVVGEGGSELERGGGRHVGCPSFGRGENESKNRFGIGRGPSRSLVENDLVCACFDILGKGRFSLTVANRHRFHPLPSTVDEAPGGRF